MPCGKRPEENAGRERQHQGEPQDARVEAEPCEAQHRQSLGHELAQPPNPPLGDEQARQPAQQSQHEAFGEELAHEPARPAPSAARTAISRRRPADRTSRRLATFTQAISRTNATAPGKQPRRRRPARFPLNTGDLVVQRGHPRAVPAVGVGILLPRAARRGDPCRPGPVDASRPVSCGRKRIARGWRG